MKRRRTGGGLPSVPPARGSCSSGKVQFATRKQAKAAARTYRDAGLGAYPCDDCSWFHIGHTPQRVRNGDVPKSAWLDATRSPS